MPYFHKFAFPFQLGLKPPYPYPVAWGFEIYFGGPIGEILVHVRLKGFSFLKGAKSDLDFVMAAVFIYGFIDAQQLAYIFILLNVYMALLSMAIKNGTG